MKCPLPEKIRCWITKEGKPVKGVFISVVLEANYKNNYGFVMGPSGENGYAELGREEILSMAEEELNLALMDYGSIEDVFVGTINVQIMTKDEIKKAIQAYNIYKDVSKTFPRDYEKDLKNATSIMSQVEVNRFKLDASVEPSQIRIVIKAPGQKIEPLKNKRSTTR